MEKVIISMDGIFAEMHEKAERGELHHLTKEEIAESNIDDIKGLIEELVDNSEHIQEWTEIVQPYSDQPEYMEWVEEAITTHNSDEFNTMAGDKEREYLQNLMP